MRCMGTSRLPTEDAMQQTLQLVEQVAILHGTTTPNRQDLKRHKRAAATAAKIAGNALRDCDRVQISPFGRVYDGSIDLDGELGIIKDYLQRAGVDAAKITMILETVKHGDPDLTEVVDTRDAIKQFRTGTVGARTALKRGPRRPEPDKDLSEGLSAIFVAAIVILADTVATKSDGNLMNLFASYSVAGRLGYVGFRTLKRAGKKPS